MGLALLSQCEARYEVYTQKNAPGGIPYFRGKFDELNVLAVRFNSGVF
jgi:hypothetical protein